jgi:hypothetical protein
MVGPGAGIVASGSATSGRRDPIRGSCSAINEDMESGERWRPHEMRAEPSNGLGRQSCGYLYRDD